MKVLYERLTESPNITTLPGVTLLSCPFCGSPVIGNEVTFWTRASIRCANRLCETEMWGNDDHELLSSVASRWNTRVIGSSKEKA